MYIDHVHVPHVDVDHVHVPHVHVTEMYNDKHAPTALSHVTNSQLHVHTYMQLLATVCLELQDKGTTQAYCLLLQHIPTSCGTIPTSYQQPCYIETNMCHNVHGNALHILTQYNSICSHERTTNTHLDSHTSQKTALSLYCLLLHTHNN